MEEELIAVAERGRDARYRLRLSRSHSQGPVIYQRNGQLACSQ